MKKKYSTYILYTITVGVVFTMVFINLISSTETAFHLNFLETVLILATFFMLLSWLNVYNRKRKFLQSSQKIAARYEKENFHTTYILGSDGLTYEDPEKFYKLKWSVFRPFYVYKNHIVLTTKENDTLFLLLSKSVVDETLYNDIQKLLGEKVGFRAAKF